MPYVYCLYLMQLELLCSLKRFCTVAVKLLLVHKADLTLRRSMVNGCCWKFYRYLASQEIPCS